ncbi:hypothetical protein C2G38_2194048 [Gigaspora rosea]|uniref:Uncharacterized protein n=1 Tax=Gigaspora rosea TaxID=44941 RepID=A0A397V686_9GLOM|nr:hypothetical protein C2G38_2194048 [Gigaspora rosea]
MSEIFGILLHPNSGMNRFSISRVDYTIPRPTYYKYKEGYAVKTSMGPSALYDLPNQRRNLLVHSIKELYNKCVILAKSFINKQATEFQQLVYKVVGGNYINDVQFYEDLKIVLEILEDLIDREKPCSKKYPKYLQKSRDKEETEYLSLYIKLTAPIKKNNQLQVYTSKPLQPNTSENIINGTADESKTYLYCQQLAEINKPETAKH